MTFISGETGPFEIYFLHNNNLLKPQRGTGLVNKLTDVIYKGKEPVNLYPVTQIP